MQLTTTTNGGAPFTGRADTDVFGQVRVDTGVLGRVRVCRIAAFPHESSDLNRISPSSVRPFYKIVFQLSGTLRLEQDDRRTVIQPGYWCIYDVSRPYSLVNLSAVEQRAILFTKDSIPDNLDRMLRLLLDLPFPMSGVSHVLMDSLDSTLNQFDAVPGAASETLGESLFELARLALIEKMTGHAMIPVRETMRERIKAYIRRNLSDPNLSVDKIARSMGCSKRYLHKVFGEMDYTVGEFIRDCRLEHCRSDLANIELRNMTITEIAFNWGFNNLSHFSQTFKLKYGISPRLYRMYSLEQSSICNGMQGDTHTNQPGLQNVMAAKAPTPS